MTIVYGMIQCEDFRQKDRFVAKIKRELKGTGIKPNFNYDTENNLWYSYKESGHRHRKVGM